MNSVLLTPLLLIQAIDPMAGPHISSEGCTDTLLNTTIREMPNLYIENTRLFNAVRIYHLATGTPLAQITLKHLMHGDSDFNSWTKWSILTDD